MDIKKTLMKNRPGLTDSSITTYNSILNNLHFGLYPDERVPKMKDFEDIELIKNYLKKKDPNVTKTIYSALFVLTENPQYKKLMLDNIKDYNDEIEEQKMTKTQEENWLNKDEIENALNNAYNKSTSSYKEIKRLHQIHGDKDIGGVFSKEFQKIQDYIILCLLSGKYINPRRSKDYVDFKISNINKNTDNYIKGNKLYFNSYKGSNNKGLQIIEIPIQLKRILTKWISNNPTEYLLFDSEYNQMSNVKLNQRLNKLFGKKASINALRHTFLTDKHGDTLVKNDELKNDMKMMGSSILQAKTYIKKRGQINII